MQTEKMVVGAPKRQFGRYTMRRLILFAGVMVGLLVIASLIFGRSIFADSQCSGKSGSKLYKDAFTALETSDANKLRPMARTIRAQKNYKKDASCLYVLIINSLNDKKYSEARAYYASFESAFNSKVGLVEDFKRYGIVNTQMVSQRIESAEYNAKSPSGAGLMLF